jgi:hypothetical protein
MNVYSDFAMPVSGRLVTICMVGVRILFPSAKPETRE